MAHEDTEYERLTQEIYQALNDSEDVKAIDVKHNVKMEGKSGCNHQIDVYWEFEMMGETHKVAIECKNFKTHPVSVGRVRDFFGVLHDIGNIKGIFVTKVGYQSGAKKYADYYGISLKEIRFPIDDDWEGRIKEISLKVSAFSIHIKERKVNLDMDWIFDNTSYKEGDTMQISAMNNELNIIDENGNFIMNFLELEDSLPREYKEEFDLKYSKTFTNGFLQSDMEIPLKIKSIDYVYDVIEYNHESLLDGEQIAKAILKDVKTGDIKFYNIAGNIK